MARGQKLVKRLKKSATSEESEQVIQEYKAGVLQHVVGRVKNVGLETFMQRFSDTQREEFETAIKRLHRITKPKRFRVAAMHLIYFGYKNGFEDGQAGKDFDITKIMQSGFDTL
jgi:hypothetical protein